jgi:hypothetical protein
MAGDTIVARQATIARTTAEITLGIVTAIDLSLARCSGIRIS